MNMFEMYPTTTKVCVGLILGGLLLLIINEIFKIGLVILPYLLIGLGIVYLIHLRFEVKKITSEEL